MKSKFVKAALLALALALTLSGCNLIAVDEVKVAQEEMEKLDEQYATVVASYDGGEVTVGEMMNDFNYAYSDSYYMYAYYFGTEMTFEDIRGIAETTLMDFTEGEIVASRFDAEHTLTEEDLAELEESIKNEYDFNLEDALLNVTGEDDEARRANAELLLKQNGMDEESIRISFTNYYKRDRMREILREEITEVDDAALKTAYDEKVALNQADYINGSAFESDMTDETAIVCWQPEGYRTVKHILVLPAEDKQAAYQEAMVALEEKEAELATLSDEMQLDSELALRTPDEIQADIKATQAAVAELSRALAAAEAACLNDVKALTDEIYARLEGGEAFEDLIGEFGQDPGMQGGISAEKGYCVAKNSVQWETNFRDAAMALENVGDYTLEPVLSGSGVHIIRYEADVVPGEVGFENVRDALYDEALASAQDAHADETIAKWVRDANPAYDTDAFMDVLYG